LAKPRRTIDKSVSQEEDLHSVIIVTFRKGTTPKEIRRIVAAQGCALQQGFDGSLLSNAVVIPKGKTDVQCIQKFLGLPKVKNAKQNEWEVTL
jgi:hypothetical protein